MHNNTTECMLTVFVIAQYNINDIHNGLWLGGHKIRDEYKKKAF